MSIVTTRKWNGYEIAVGGVHLNDADDVDTYTVWVTAPDGADVVWEAEAYGRESAVMRWGEERAQEHCRDGQEKRDGQERRKEADSGVQS